LACLREIPCSENSGAPPCSGCGETGQPLPRALRLRRELIIGGVAAISVLRNRSALAATACSHSVWRSHLTEGAAFLSHGSLPTSGCGDTPECWALPANQVNWTIAGGGGVNINPNAMFRSVFTQITTSGWSIVTASGGAAQNATLLQCLTRGAYLVQLNNNPSRRLNANFTASAVAALLNANWYGSAFDPALNTAAAVQALVNTDLSNNFLNANPLINAFVATYGTGGKSSNPC
jgi:hypothetical protein